MAFPVSYLNNGVLSLAYVLPFTNTLYKIVKGPNEGSLVFAEDIVTGA